MKRRRLIEIMDSVGPSIYHLYRELELTNEDADNRFIGYWIDYYVSHQDKVHDRIGFMLSAMAYIEARGELSSPMGRSRKSTIRKEFLIFRALSYEDQVESLKNPQPSEYGHVLKKSQEVPVEIRRQILRFLRKRSRAMVITMTGFTAFTAAGLWLGLSSLSEEVSDFIEEHPLEVIQEKHDYEIYVIEAKMIEEILYVTFDLSDKRPSSPLILEAWLPKVTAHSGQVMFDGQKYVAAFDLKTSDIKSKALEMRVEVTQDNKAEAVLYTTVAYDRPLFENFQVIIDETYVYEGTTLEVHGLEIIEGYPWLTCTVTGSTYGLMTDFDVELRDDLGNTYPMEAISAGGYKFSQEETAKIHPQAKVLSLEIQQLNQYEMVEYPFLVGEQTIGFRDKTIHMELINSEEVGTWIYMSYEDGSSSETLPQLHIKLKDHWYPVFGVREDRQYPLTKSDLAAGGNDVTAILSYYFETYDVRLDPIDLMEKLSQVKGGNVVYIDVDQANASILRFDLTGYGPPELQAFGYRSPVASKDIHYVIPIMLKED